MITLKMNDTTYVHGDPNEVAAFYSSFLCYLQVLKPSVDRHITEQEAMARIAEQLKSLKIEPIRKEGDPDAGQQSSPGEDRRV